MPESGLASVEAYYQAMHNKSISGMAEYLHPDVRFVGPLAQISGKEAVLEAVERLMPFFSTITIRAKFGSTDQTMVAYDLNCSEPIGILRVAALMKFDDGLISRIELFFDARPFEKKKD
ncbi:MAG: nuclear transport factor 2 family protein [Alphaproteobacteria bacterium]